MGIKEIISDIKIKCELAESLIRLQKQLPNLVVARWVDCLGKVHKLWIFSVQKLP